jgi:hypothetical protein
MAGRKRKIRVVEAWLEHLERVAAVGVRHRDPRAMRVLLGIERLRVRLRRRGEAGGEMSGVPITIFGAAIREMERLRGGGEVEEQDRNSLRGRREAGGEAARE